MRLADNRLPFRQWSLLVGSTDIALSANVRPFASIPPEVDGFTRYERLERA